MEHDIQIKLCGDYVSPRDKSAQCWLDHAEYAERSQIVASLYLWGATQQCECIQATLMISICDDHLRSTEGGVG